MFADPRRSLWKRKEATIFKPLAVPNADSDVRLPLRPLFGTALLVFCILSYKPRCADPTHTTDQSQIAS